MISTTIIQDLIIYFARFIPIRVRKEMLKQPQNARFAGYEEVKADILNVSEVQALPDFDSFVVSVNNKLVSDRKEFPELHAFYRVWRYKSTDGKRGNTQRGWFIRFGSQRVERGKQRYVERGNENAAGTRINAVDPDGYAGRE